jgi:hypothetical protein
MRNFKCIFFQLTIILTFHLAIAQEARDEASCHVKVDREYSYQTEVLLHEYERAKVSPKEFESLRTELTTHRESALLACEQNDLAEMDKFVEDIQISTVVMDPNADRGIASVGGRRPASIMPMPRQAQGDYADVDSSDVANEDFIHEYDGERVRVGN